VDLSKYTIETYMRIVTYKTAFYTFYLPAAAAMHLSGLTDARAFALARDICVRLGQFFQIQDDYLDCYGDPAVIGKVGTDIEDNKCSWLVVQALARCTDAQRKVFEARDAPARRTAAAAPQRCAAARAAFAEPC
jgi:farnesyl diphosphate synthase